MTSLHLINSTFDQMKIRPTQLSVRWKFGQMKIRSDENSVRWKFDQLKIRSADRPTWKKDLELERTSFKTREMKVIIAFFAFSTRLKRVLFFSQSRNSKKTSSRGCQRERKNLVIVITSSLTLSTWKSLALVLDWLWVARWTHNNLFEKQLLPFDLLCITHGW